jgi:hypothetical protein
MTSSLPELAEHIAPEVEFPCLEFNAWELTQHSRVLAT